MSLRWRCGLMTLAAVLVLTSPVLTARAQELPKEPPGVLKLGARGTLVTDLQRTLNVRLSPSPQLKLDGVFGDSTHEAVARFQKSKKLDANGVVNADTWRALGALVTHAPPIPSSDVINRQELKRTAADPLDGPPFVTCKAWAIGDGKTGKLLWGSNENTRRHFASTTKIMTAYIVLGLAQKDKRVLAETVTFSERADQTGGSTAALRAGEKLTVGELLYGLMLPSGNDASVALAEHFGDRFDPGEQDEKSSKSEKEKAPDPLDRFIAEMNRTAKRLGMKETRYANPHGLTARQHLSTAKDLLRLAWNAMQMPRFREYVSARQFGCQVTGPGGYRRNVLWKNTNQLLPIQGYDGVKTGTTSAAGACLVSSGRRGEDHLIVIVLGATSTDARYVDTRNLFRWAWRMRGHK